MVVFLPQVANAQNQTQQKNVQSCPGIPIVIDQEGNAYNTVQIGNQCWMKENLRTTLKPDGTEIANSELYCPNNDVHNVFINGYLYTWNAMMNGAASSDANPSGVQGICPTGWHVPSDAEWAQLTDYVSSKSEYLCESNTDYIAKALAATIGWNSSTTTCHVGNDQNYNNVTGFGALPAGCYSSGYYFFGNCVYFWSATQYNSYDAYDRAFAYNYADVHRLPQHRAQQLHVGLQCQLHRQHHARPHCQQQERGGYGRDRRGRPRQQPRSGGRCGVSEPDEGRCQCTMFNVQCSMYNVQGSKVNGQGVGIEIVDVYGKVVTTVVGVNNDSPTQINVSGLAAGMYFVRVTTDRGVVTKPFVKR